jgi:serine/threonine protein kinase
MDQLSYTRVGTPYYLPPEIIRCQPYTSKADVWSLGVTIYHLACLSLPFQGQNIIRLGQAITYQQPHFPAHLPALLAEAL